MNYSSWSLQSSGRFPASGSLTVYDTTLRIGARLALEPSKVYLHAGTLAGAKALGLDWRGGTIEMSQLPAELRTLAPREAEDVLCIYKDKFANSSVLEPTSRCSTGSSNSKLVCVPPSA
jgi:hypothetical protein